MPFVHAYIVDGIIPEEKTILGYRDMYQQIATQLREEHPLLIVELGTNHAELNVQELKQLGLTASLHIFLCVASTDTCRTRALERNQTFVAGALERRLQRNFPESHIPLLKEASLDYTMLDMEQPLERNEAIVRGTLNTSSDLLASSDN
jgi:hypothetical protein